MLTRGGAVRWFKVTRAGPRTALRPDGSAERARSRRAARLLRWSRWRCSALLQQRWLVRRTPALVAAAAGRWRCWPGAWRAATPPARGRARAGLRHRAGSARAPGGSSSACTATAACRPGWRCWRWRCSRRCSRSTTPRRWPRGALAAPRRGRAATRCCSPRSGCWPSWRAAVSSPAFRGSRAATRTSTGRSPCWRPGSASTASARCRRCRRPSAGAARLRARCRASGAARPGARAGRRAASPRRCAGRVPTSRAPPARSRVTLLQGNVPQDEKFEPASSVPQALAWYGASCWPRAATWSSAPETVDPAAAEPARPTATGGAAASTSSAPGRAALVGMPLGDEAAATPTRPSASRPRRRRCPAASTATTSTTCVPFGEFIPPGFQLVHAADEHPARRLQPRRGRRAVVRRRTASASRAEHLLRGPVRRGARGALR